MGERWVFGKEIAQKGRYARAGLQRVVLTLGNRLDEVENVVRFLDARCTPHKQIVAHGWIVA
jgi:hypothetical protein